jgi:hypothetical protein
MLWIMCAVLLFVCTIVAVFLMSCLAIAQQADEQSARAYSAVVGNSAAQMKLL